MWWSDLRSRSLPSSHITSSHCSRKHKHQEIPASNHASRTRRTQRGYVLSQTHRDLHWRRAHGSDFQRIGLSGQQRLLLTRRSNFLAHARKRPGAHRHDGYRAHLLQGPSTPEVASGRCGAHPWWRDALARRNQYHDDGAPGD